MANGYGTSSSSGTSAGLRSTNGQKKNAPIGYHYMAGGQLMSDAEHLRKFGGSSYKIIGGIEMDFTNININGELRTFVIKAKKDSVFNLEIKDGDGNYYNFDLEKFEAKESKLSRVLMTKDEYTVNIVFPARSAATQYDIYLIADEPSATKHAAYREVKNEDGSVNINSSSGSDCLMLRKVLFQTADAVLTITPFSLSNATAYTSLTAVSDTVTSSIGVSTGKVPFKISVTSQNGKAFTINQPPRPNMFAAFVTRTIGDPITISGEDTYPTARAAFTGDDVNGAVTSGADVRMDATDISANIALGDKITDTIDGAVHAGIGGKIVMDNNVAGKMSAGDAITGNPQLDHASAIGSPFTVRELNPDGDNAKEFSIGDGNGIEVKFEDGATLTFSSKVNRSLTTVAGFPATETDFTMSQAIQFRDDQPLTFSPAFYYKWSMANSEGLVPGVNIKNATNITGNPFITTEADLNLDSGGDSRRRARVEKTEPPVFTRDGTTKVVTKTQAGNIVFSEQQLDALKDDSIKFYGYGKNNIKSLLGWDVEISNVQATLTVPTTNTAAAVDNSVTVTVDSGHGIMDDVTTISSVNIDSSVADPKVTTIASYNVSSAATATLTLSAAQTLEDNELLTLNGAGQTITITGDITVKNAEASATLRLDIDQFITATTETA